MNLLINPNLSILAGVIIVNTALAALVYRNNRKSATNIIFALLSTVVSLWLVANYISINPKFISSSLFWIRLTIFLAVPQAALFFLLAHTLPNTTLQLKLRTFFTLLALTLFAMAAAISPYGFSEVEIVSGSPQPVPGLGIVMFMAISISMVIAAVYVLIKKLKQSSGVEKQQLIFVLTGISAMVGAIIFTIVIPVIFLSTNNFVSYTPVYTSFFLGMTAYAIFRHNLFNIRVIATEAFTAIIIFIFLINLLSSVSSSNFFVNFILLALIIIFGAMLVRGTLREIRELERLSQAKSDFVSIVSHQLRTPLTAIKGFVSMVNEHSGTEDERKDWLKKTFMINERLIRLVSDILNVSRIEEGRMKYDFKPIDIIALVDSVVLEASVAADDKSLNLLWQKPDVETPPINADEIKLRQVILNLVDNSIKYTSKGWVSVRLIHYKDLRKVRIIVQDTGVGMSKDDLVNLFGRFVRGKEGKKTNVEGMGIGLYVARHIVDAHNGKIWAESEGPGAGSKFFVELPVN